jgi:hypothetical protein
MGAPQGKCAAGNPLKAFRSCCRKHAVAAIAGIITLSAAGQNVEGQDYAPGALDRPAAQAQADIARLFGCRWKTTPMHAECNDIRHVGIRLDLDLDPTTGLIDSVEMMAQLKGRKFTPEQRRYSDQTVIALVQYFAAGWPSGGRWARLIVGEAGAEHADATVMVGGIVLSSEYVLSNVEDGQHLLFLNIRRKKD